MRVWRIGLAVAVAGCSDDLTSSTAGSTGSASDSPSTGASAEGTAQVDSSTTGSSTPGGDSNEVSSSSESSSGNPILDDAGSFFTPVDHGSSHDACTTFAQDCPGGQKCMPYSTDQGIAWNALGCFPVVEDPAGIGEPCVMKGFASGLDTCDIGSMCFNIDETSNGISLEFCSGSYAAGFCSDPDETCVEDSSGILNLCLPVCNPLLQDCEQEGYGCWPRYGDWICGPLIGPPAGAGEPCNGHNTCEIGLICMGADSFTDCDGAGCCTPVCDDFDEGSDAACAELDPAMSCAPWYMTPPPGYEAVGACVVPNE